MHVLNIPVSDDLQRTWRAHLAPDLQPFFLTPEQQPLVGDAVCLNRKEFGALRVPLTLTDTFALYHVKEHATHVAWLDEPSFDALPGPARSTLLRTQLDHGRGGIYRTAEWLDVLADERADLFVWWPSRLNRLSAAQQRTVLEREISEDRRPCRRAEVSDAVWQTAAGILPHARRLAGTFAPQSGPNCLGTVMAAAGVPAAEHQWMHLEPFERWLAARTVDGGELGAPGTVMVWRDAHGHAQHAAVTLGDGWALNKDAQGWFAPRQVLRVSDLVENWAGRSCRIEHRALR